MALKFKINSKADVPAEHAVLYTERDGALFLDVEGAVEKAKLDEFRSNNIALTRERDELKQRFDGIDPDEVRKLADEKRRLEEAAQLKAGEIEKVFENRTKALKGDFDKQLSLVTTERDTLARRNVRNFSFLAIGEPQMLFGDELREEFLREVLSFIRSVTFPTHIDVDGIPIAATKRFQPWAAASTTLQCVVAKMRGTTTLVSRSESDTVLLPVGFNRTWVLLSG